MSAPKVALHIAKFGTITLELDAEKAPITVANFLEYVKKEHYNGTVFHRVIPGFMIQGGGFATGMKQKPTASEIQNEANNGLKNDIYTIAMARTSAPHSASATETAATIPLRSLPRTLITHFMFESFHPRDRRARFSTLP